jgi:sulfate/thiosulfate transport system ATP-binding protein
MEPGFSYSRRDSKSKFLSLSFTPAEVYHHRANAFVYNFLGNVNLFHGRVEEGKVYLGDVPIDLPYEAAEDAKTALVFIRPHLLEIELQPNGDDHFRARVEHVNAAGSVVKVDLITDWGEPVHVELPHERYRTLGLKRDDRVFVIPKERKIFTDERTALNGAERGLS